MGRGIAHQTTWDQSQEVTRFIIDILGFVHLDRHVGFQREIKSEKYKNGHKLPQENLYTNLFLFSLYSKTDLEFLSKM